MQFDSPIFFLAFLPFAIALIFAAPRRYSNVAIIILSLVFYTWGEPRFALVVVASAAFDWIVARTMHRIPEDRGRRSRKLLLLATIGENVGLLVFYKYLAFAVGNLDRVLSLAGGKTFAVPSIALPIGVSFVVFEKITYVVDLYRGVALPANSFLDYLAYVLLFPKLLAGPIVKYHEIADQLKVRPKNLEDIREGATRFCYGMGKKVLIADLSGDIANAVFLVPVARLGFQEAWLGALAFSVQIYFDFSAYSDMAIGIARVLGFRLRENFNYPYTAQNITEFWRRWHISLSSWIREYIYIPLGGSRAGKGRTYLNLTVAFLLCGIWHGAAWTFVVWGIFQGLFLVMDRAFWLEKQMGLPVIARQLGTFLIVTVSWVIFRSPDISHAVGYLGVMASVLKHGTFLYLRNDQIAAMILGYILIAIPFAKRYQDWADRFVGMQWAPDSSLCASMAVLVLAIGRVSAASFSPFLYFRF